MNNKTCKQFLAMLLLFAMLVGFIPAISAPALAVAPPQITVTTEDELRDALENTSYTNIAIDDGGTEFTLTAPIEIKRNVNLQGLNRKTGEHAKKLNQAVSQLEILRPSVVGTKITVDRNAIRTEAKIALK